MQLLLRRQKYFYFLAPYPLFHKSKFSLSNLRALTYCWKCAAPINPTVLFCNQSSCNALQPFSLHKTNIFHVFKLDEDFDIDTANLSAQFKDLQRLLHPDKFVTRSAEERDYSANASSEINQAYEILKSPVKRAEYMVKAKFGIDIFDDAKANVDFEGKNSLMTKVFEINEYMENIDGDQSKISGLLESLQKSADEYSQDFRKSLLEEDRDKAIKAAVHLKYYYKMVDDLKEMTDTD